MADRIAPGAIHPSRRAFLKGAAGIGAATVLAARAGPSAAATGAETTPGVLADRLVHAGPAAFGPGHPAGVVILDRLAESGLHAAAPGASYESPVLPLGFAATHLGLRWTADGRGATGLTFAARTSENGRDWTAWLVLPVGGVRADGPSSEGFSALAGVPRGRFAQYRVTFAGEPGATLRRLTLSYLNAHDGPEWPLSTTWPRPAFPFPFRSREQWGADEALRFDASGDESWPRMYVPVKKLVVHHTATTNDYTDAAAEVRAIYVYHAQELEWGDIGYHALIGRDGVVYEGRRGRGPARDPGVREAISPGVVGGHAFFHNYGTAGYALIGTFVDTPLPALMRERVVDLLAYEARRHGIDPLTLGDFVRSDGIWHRDLPNLAGHRDCVVTECPGEEVYRLLPEIRDAVAERLGGRHATRLARVLFESAPPPADTTARMGAAVWAGVGPALPGWTYARYLEYWRRDGAYNILPPDNGPGWRRYEPGDRTTLSELVPGHYTLHLRGRDPLGHEAVYETHTSFRVTDELLADDEDLGQTRREGRWQRRTDGTGILGESWAEAPAGGGESVFRWRPLVSEHGRYEVWVRWPTIAGLATNAPYAVHHADGVHREPCDQRGGGGEWRRLGGDRLFRFESGVGDRVSLGNAADGPVAADAVKLVLRERLRRTAGWHGP